MSDPNPPVPDPANPEQPQQPADDTTSPAPGRRRRGSRCRGHGRAAASAPAPRRRVGPRPGRRCTRRLRPGQPAPAAPSGPRSGGTRRPRPVAVGPPWRGGRARRAVRCGRHRPDRRAGGQSPPRRRRPRFHHQVPRRGGLGPQQGPGMGAAATATATGTSNGNGKRQGNGDAPSRRRGRPTPQPGHAGQRHGDGPRCRRRASVRCCTVSSPPTSPGHRRSWSCSPAR